MAPNEAILLVARFLKSHDYTETLDALIREANLSRDAGTTGVGDLTIEKVLEEKRVFDVSLKYEKMGDEDGKQWLPAAPAIANPVPGPTSSNILHLSFARVSASPMSDEKKHLILATTADRRLNALQVPSCALQTSLLNLQDSPILACAVLKGSYLLTGSMSGQIIVSDLEGKILDQRRDHNKYVVQVAVHATTGAIWIATAGWDAKVNLYKLNNDEAQPKLGEPVATINLPTNPEALLFIDHPDDGRPILIVTRRDSTHLFYHSAEPGAPLLGKQNIAPHANSWTHQTPSSLALCPTDNTLVAIATSAIPHMKLLLVRLMVPTSTQPGLENVATWATPSGQSDESETAPASAARAALALQNLEDAAILIHCTTMAPQTAYSTPSLAWRPDGSGVWVNSDDGVLRGIEASTGKVVAALKGHDAGSKIRCLCSGLVEEDGRTKEWLVSGGFDQKLIVWKPEE